MITVPESGRLIAFCGIDGPASRSLVARLDQENVIPGAVFLHKARKSSLNLVSKHGARDEAGNQNWARGDFAENAAAASSVDFLHHYDTVIAPRLARRMARVRSLRAVLRSLQSWRRHSSSRARSFQSDCARPDWLVFVDSPVEVVLQRIAARGGPSEDEQPAAIRCHREAYLSLLNNRRTCQHCFWKIPGTSNKPTQTLRQHVEHVISSWTNNRFDHDVLLVLRGRPGLGHVIPGLAIGARLRTAVTKWRS